MQSTTIILKNKQNNNVYFGLIFYGFIHLSLLILFVFIIRTLIDNPVYLVCYAIIALGIVFYLSRNYFKNVIISESIVVDTNNLKVICKTALGERTSTFNLDDILYFSFAGYQEFTNHTMDSKVFDITGLGVGEKQLQYLIAEGTIEIETAKTKHRFGKNLASWDVQELIDQIEALTGKRLENKYKEEEITDDETDVELP